MKTYRLLRGDAHVARFIQLLYRLFNPKREYGEEGETLFYSDVMCCNFILSAD